MSASKEGLFITLEGGEGSGKTTLAKKLQEWLESQGREVLLTREPGGSPLATEIRKLVLEKAHVPAKAELLLFLAARAEHVEELIKPALAKGNVVICDRYQDSTVAYQGYARGLGIVETMRLSEFSTGNLLPQLTLYLDIDPKLGLERAKKAIKIEKTDRMELEKLDFHQKVRRGFLTLAELFPRRIRTINASDTPESVLNQAINLIKPQLL